MKKSIEDIIKQKQIDNEANKTAVRTLKFSQHMLQFSKFVSFVFVLIYGITWLTYIFITIKMYYDTNIFDKDILDFVLSPTLVILGFYFSTKVLENVSDIVMTKLTNITQIKVDAEEEDGDEH